MDPELLKELTELLSRWHELAEHAGARAQSHPNSTYDGYLLALEVAADDLTRVLGKTLRQHEVKEANN